MGDAVKIPCPLAYAICARLSTGCQTVPALFVLAPPAVAAGASSEAMPVHAFQQTMAVPRSERSSKKRYEVVGSPTPAVAGYIVVAVGNLPFVLECSVWHVSSRRKVREYGIERCSPGKVRPPCRCAVGGRPTREEQVVVGGAIKVARVIPARIPTRFPRHVHSEMVTCRCRAVRLCRLSVRHCSIGPPTTRYLQRWKKRC